MTDTNHKNLPLILSRQLASNLATAMFLIDAAGMLVYFNEAAGEMIGKTFEQVGELPAAEWAELLSLEDLAGARLSRRETPGGVAFRERRPAHRMLFATVFDGTRKRVALTAYPLFSRHDEFAGVVLIVWENGHAGSTEDPAV